MTTNEMKTLNEIDAMLRVATKLSETGNIEEAVKIIEDSYMCYINHFVEEGKPTTIEDDEPDEFTKNFNDIYEPVRITILSMVMMEPTRIF